MKHHVLAIKTIVAVAVFCYLWVTFPLFKAFTGWLLLGVGYYAFAYVAANDLTKSEDDSHYR